MILSLRVPNIHPTPPSSGRGRPFREPGGLRSPALPGRSLRHAGRCLGRPPLCLWEAAISLRDPVRASAGGLPDSARSLDSYFRTAFSLCVKLHRAHRYAMVVQAVAHGHHAVSVETASRHCEHALNICCLKALMIKSLDG